MKQFKRLFVLGFCLILAAIGTLTVWMPQSGLSYYENRTLEALPAFSGASVLSGEWFDSIETYLTDHVPGRTVWLKSAAWVRLNVLKQPVLNNVVQGDDVLLGYHGYNRWGTDYLPASARNAVAELHEICTAAEAYGADIYYLGVPEQFSYFQNRYPDYMENRSWLYSDTDIAMRNALNEVGISFVSMYDAYRAMDCPKEYYFATDHHYTVYGALAAAQNLLETINQSGKWSLFIPQQEDFEFVTLSNPFLGSRNRKLFGLRSLEDHATVASYRDQISFTRTDNGQSVESTVLELPKTDQETITYSIFMGGDIGCTVIDTERSQLPNALIIGESFTNALETILYYSFHQLHSIDPRHFSGNIADYISEYQPDIIIFVRDNTAYFSTLGRTS